MALYRAIVSSKMEGKMKHLLITFFLSHLFQVLIIPTLLQILKLYNCVVFLLLLSYFKVPFSNKFDFKSDKFALTINFFNRMLSFLRKPVMLQYKLNCCCQFLKKTIVFQLSKCQTIKVVLQHNGFTKNIYTRLYINETLQSSSIIKVFNSLDKI